MEKLSVRDLIKAGFHFGHRTSRWNPKMKPYIFKRKNLIHIIDLRATLRGLITGRKIATAVASRDDYILFVGTKKQAKGHVGRQADLCDMPYVAERWPGGLLTNYVTIRQRLDRLLELEQLEQTGDIQLYSKKMVSSLKREKRKILRNLGGVREMNRLPGLLVIVDPARERIAVREARKLGIPIIALTDTDGMPDDVDVVVPGNDDSIGAIEIFLKTMSQAARQGKAGHKEAPAPEPEAAVPTPTGPAAEPATAQTAAQEEAPEPETTSDEPASPSQTDEEEQAPEAGPAPDETKAEAAVPDTEDSDEAPAEEDSQ